MAGTALQRARNPQDKLARREAILEVAARVLSRSQFARVTMAQIAEHCGLAKGTLYLYFATKEELFLATLEDELAAWFDALGGELLGRGNVTAREFADTVVASLGERERLADLLPLLHTVLEHNIAPEVALRFKRMLVGKLEAGGALAESVLVGLPSGHGIDLLLRTHALVVGLRQMADAPPALREILARDELAPLRVDFAAQLTEALAAMTQGMLDVRVTSPSLPSPSSARTPPVPAALPRP
jgi:AcrR family transcriptional regulator